MQNQDHAIRPEELLSHDAWVRRLARGLIADPARAEDAVQDAWLAALDRPPANRDDLRAWFSRVTRRRAADRGRRDAARAEREEHVARDATAAGAPSTAELARRAELQRDVADALLELKEPYRSTLLLRFFEDLAPRQIAQRTGRPVDTVRTHMERGLAQLRARLDGRYGDRATWAGGLVVLAQRGEMKVAGAAGIAGRIAVIFTAAGARWLTAAALVIAVGLFMSNRGNDGEVALEAAGAERPDGEPTDPGVRVDAIDDEVVVAEEGQEVARVTVETPDPGLPASAEPVEPAEVVRGVLVDELGQPLAGRVVQLVPKGLPRWGGENGDWFETDSESSHIPADLKAMLLAYPPGLDKFVAEFEFPELAKQVFLGTFEPVRVVTDARGLFEFGPGEEYHAAYADAKMELAAEDLRLLFAFPTPDRDDERLVAVAAPVVEVAGVVVDQDGVPIDDVSMQVRVSSEDLTGFPYRAEINHVRSWGAHLGEDGRFELTVPRTAGTLIDVGAPGYRYTKVAVPDVSRHDLVVTLEPRPAPTGTKLSGVVLDADGAPVAKAGVSLGYKTGATNEQGRFELVVGSNWKSSDYLRAYSRTLGYGKLSTGRMAGTEDLVIRLGGAPLGIGGVLVDADGEPLEGVAVNVVDVTPHAGLHGGVEGLIGGEDETGPTGRFALSGLDHRAYQLRFMRVDPPLYLVSEPIEAGAGDVHIQVPSDYSRGEIEGRVVDRFGRAIDTAVVALVFDKATAPTGKTFVTVGDTRVDDNGRFRLVDVPRRDVEVRVSGPGVDSTSFAIADVAGADATLVVGRRLRFRVELAADDPADAFQLLDEAGDVLWTDVIFPDLHTVRRNVEREDDGRFPLTEVTDVAATIVFLQGDVELRRTVFEAFREPARQAVVTLAY